MERAPDFEAVIEQSYALFTSGDVAGFERLISRDPQTLAIATDPREWWEGPELIHQALRAQITEMRELGVQAKPGRIQAYREGSVGWAADRPTFRLPDGTELPMRITLVGHQEAGEWKIVQFHASLGVSNEEALGQELTIPQ